MYQDSKRTWGTIFLLIIKPLFGGALVAVAVVSDLLKLSNPSQSGAFSKMPDFRFQRRKTF